MQSDPATWKVVGQRQTSQYQPGGGLIDGLMVTFTTGGMHTGQVFIPTPQLGNHQYVAQAIQERADALDKIGTLSSEDLQSKA